MTWAAWLPAIILPLSTGLALRALLRGSSAEGHSMLTWSLFLLANLGAYFGAPDRYFLIEHILAFLLSAVLDVFIVWRIWVLRRQQPTN